MLLPNFNQLQHRQHISSLQVVRKTPEKQDIRIKQLSIKPIKQILTSKNQQQQKMDIDQTVYLHVVKCMMPEKKIKRIQHTVQRTNFKYSRQKQQKQNEKNLESYNFQMGSKYQYGKQKQKCKIQQENDFFKINSTSTVEPVINNNPIRSRIIRRGKHNSTEMSLKQKGQRQLQHDQIILKDEKLNLGLKGKQKGKIKQFMQNILARTKIDEDVPIKRIPFQNQYNVNKKNQSLSKQKKQPRQQQSTSKKISRVEKKRLNNLKRIPKSSMSRGSQVNLPNVNKYRNIIEIVKKDQRQRKKKFFQNASQSQNLPQILLPKKTALQQNEKKKKKDENCQVIEQQIQNFGQKEQKRQQIIQESIQIQY